MKDYHLLGPLGQNVVITKAVYNATNDTVTLHLKRRINFHRDSKLTVNGTSPTGLTDVQGLLLDGKANDQPGSNYNATITKYNLVWPNAKSRLMWRGKPVRESHVVKPISGREAHPSHLFKRSVSFPDATVPQIGGETVQATTERTLARPGKSRVELLRRKIPSH